MKLSRPKLIGITGGIATGKSTVSKALKDRGYRVVDADEIARAIVEQGRPAYVEIIDFFGEEILDRDLNIDRKKLASIIFKKETLREKLNQLTHPHIYKEIKEEIDRQGKGQSILFLDIPLLIEGLADMEKHRIQLDEIWLVYIDEKTQLDRLMKRDGLGKEAALSRINSQMSIELKREYADRILDNRGNIRGLEEQIDEILNEII